jgi:hypothetical protein
MAIHQLTEVVLAVLGFTEFPFQGFKAVIACLEEADSLQMSHPVTLGIVHAIGEVDFMR